MIALNLVALFVLSRPVIGAVINTDSILSGRSTAVDPAVVFNTWSDTRACNTDSKSSWTNSDVDCFSLPGQSLNVNSIADTCRTFIYGNTDCTGTEMQVYPGTCYDVRTFHTLKTFCN